jgi:MOSC domain-containing protein YiiM
VLRDIYIAPASRAQPHRVEEAMLIAGKGIVGDRKFREQGTRPDKELTLIAAEEIDAFNVRTGLAVTYGAMRRNLVTLGIDLNGCVGRKLRVGSIEIEGLELCEPCAIVGALLATATTPARAVVRELAHRAGLRARIVEGGVIRSNDLIVRTS